MQKLESRTMGDDQFDEAGVRTRKSTEPLAASLQILQDVLGYGCLLYECKKRANGLATYISITIVMQVVIDTGLDTFCYLN